jgi:hypothetical protein
MWNNDLPVTLNVDVQCDADVPAAPVFGGSAMRFFPFPRVENLSNSQECGMQNRLRKRPVSP